MNLSPKNYLDSRTTYLKYEPNLTSTYLPVVPLVFHLKNPVYCYFETKILFKLGNMTVFFRCLSGSLLYSPPHHWHPALLLGAGSGSEDTTWEHRGVELCVSPSGRRRGVQSDGKGKV